MTLLTPLGFLALLSVVALIIIYIIRPNYQQKFVSSTFVWKLALKRKRKRIPTSKLRNILLIICQVMILLSLTALLTTPSQPLEVKADAVEVIAIVDTSASMRTKNSDNVSRFERALEKVTALADEAFNNDGLVSLMFAGNTNKFVIEKVSKEDRELLDTAIDEALGRTDEESECTYGTGDLDQAIIMCQEVIETNPSTQIYVYSDIDYGYVPKEVNYERIYDTAEGNLAILNAYAENVNSYYNFHFDVASYGKDAEIKLDIHIKNANAADNLGAEKNIVLQDVSMICTDSQVTSLVICSKSNFTEDDKIISEEKGIAYLSLEDFYSQSETGITNVYSFDSISVQIDLGNNNQVDSYSYDNSFNIYGGKKDVVKVEYVSTDPCRFMQTILEVCTTQVSDYWDLRVDERKVGYGDDDNTSYATEGYDIYFFEHKMPEILPVDGIVVLINPSPSQQPFDAGFSVVRQETSSKPQNFVVEDNHNIFANVRVADIQTTKFTYLQLKDDFNYKVIASVNRSPVIAVREEVGGTPVVLMGFDLHYSNLPVMSDFVIYMINLFEHFLPPTVKSHAFEVYENIELNARSPELTVIDANTSGNMLTQTFEIFPTQTSFAIPGTYEFSQTTYTNKKITDTIYVRCPMSESNIFEKKDALIAPYKPEVIENKFKDLMFYVAVALAVLLFLEWFLQSRDNM